MATDSSVTRGSGQLLCERLVIKLNASQEVAVQSEGLIELRVEQRVIRQRLDQEDGHQSPPTTFIRLQHGVDLPYMFYCRTSTSRLIKILALCTIGSSNGYRLEQSRAP